MKVDALYEINRSLQLGYVPDNSESLVVKNTFIELGEKIEDIKNRHQDYDPTPINSDDDIEPSILGTYQRKVGELRKVHLKVLSHKEKRVMALFNNFDLEEEQKWNRTAEEIGIILRISEGRVNQIMEKAIRKLSDLGGLL